MRLLIVALLGFLAQAAPAQEMSARFAVRAVGVKVGDLVMVGSATATRYSVSSQFTTTGMVGAVAGVKFVLSATGARRGERFLPARYREEMDTGRRQSRATLTYSRSVARAAGSRIGDRGPHAVTDAEQRGAVDPLTAMFMVLRDQPRNGLCTLRQKVFDGERLTEVELTKRSESGSDVTCAGEFRRIGGYAPDDLRRGTRFALTVLYRPAGDLMRAVRIRAATVYGPAAIIRR